MNGKLIEAQIKHHRNQIASLEKELAARKSSAEKRISKLQDEHDREISRIQQHIAGHEEKIKELIHQHPG